MNTQQPTPMGLYVLPFDHQNSLIKLFGWSDALTPEQIEFIKQTRMITYEGYLHGISLGIPADQTAILTDDLYGNDVLQRAASESVPIIYTLEKSGQARLVFAHDNWKEIVLRDKPTWIKTLIRYNPSANRDDLDATRLNLRLVSDFARENGFGFMIEPLVIPTDTQKDIPDFDHTTRPELTLAMLTELYKDNIYPTIWKIEGSDSREFYTQVANLIASYDKNARIVVLGRNESFETVEKWLIAGSYTNTVIGFAIGRTVFADILIDVQSGNITRQEASERIGRNYFKLYQAFTQNK